MCCPSVSGSFIAISVVTYISVFVLTLLNMIFSILTPKQFETFINVKYTNYNDPVSASFLMNMQFGSDLVSDDDSYGYGSTGKKEELCIRGRCTLSSYNIYNTLNCSNACFANLNECYYSETKCKEMKCEKYIWNDPQKVCQTYHNKINKWRNVGVAKISRKFEYTPLKHIITGGECPAGYKKCGKVNTGNFLCLIPDDEYGCPINKIVITDTNTPPEDIFKYKSSKFGNKYIFYTNENVNGYLIQNLNHISYEGKGPAEVPNKIDSDTFKNVLLYNPDIFSGKYTLKKLSGYIEPQDSWTSFLVTLNYNTSKTLEEMKQIQAKYEERNKIYNEASIKTMNEKVKSFKGVLMGFGIASFASFACIAIFFIPIYSANDCGKQCSKSCDCGLCQNITPIKRVALFYLVCSPTVIFSIFAFFFTLSKKSTYSEYSSMQYIDEYKNMVKKDRFYDYETYDFFGKSITYNNAQFIILLIILIFIIVYPILIWITSPSNEEMPSTKDIEKAALNDQGKRNQNNEGKKKNKQKNKDESYNSTELMPSYNSDSNAGYNSHPPQDYNQGYGYQPPNYQPNLYPPQQNYQPNMYPAYVAPQPQNQYQGEQPYYH
jgi:hypothetical protein